MRDPAEDSRDCLVHYYEDIATLNSEARGFTLDRYARTGEAFDALEELRGIAHARDKGRDGGPAASAGRPDRFFTTSPFLLTYFIRSCYQIA